MSRLKLISFILGASVLLVLGAWLLGYVIDSSDGEVVRNVQLTSPDGDVIMGIGGLSEADLRALLEDMNSEYTLRPVNVELPEGADSATERAADQATGQAANQAAGRIETTFGEVGIGIDIDRTVEYALLVGRIGNFFERASKWVGSAFDNHQTVLFYDIDPDLDSAFFSDLEDIVLAEPTDAELVEGAATAGEPVAIKEGTAGSIICASDIADAVAAADFSPAEEISVSGIATRQLPSRTDNDSLGAQIAALNQATADGLVVYSANASQNFSAAEVRSWLEVKLEISGEVAETCEDLQNTGSSKLSVSIADPEALLPLFEERFVDNIVPGNFGTITIINGEPVAMNPSPGSRCCAVFDTDLILHALFSPRSPRPPEQPQEIELAPDENPQINPEEPADPEAQADPSDPAPANLAPAISIPVRIDPELMPDFAADGEIKEIVGEFTTPHRPDIPSNPQPRVTNIQRFADLVRGEIINPGDTFSLNDFVGERTEAKGFVEAGVIYKGVFTEDVGGGVSQFATTFFNAAFFAGLDFLEYHSHSLYISRYPYGREATISWPYVDLEVQNNTPYPVMIWTSYTADSITVTFYSTKWAEVEQTDQISIAEGECVRVHTERTRTLLDGTRKVDRVTALYRPSEGLNCLGEPEVSAPDCEINEIGIDTDDDEWPDACQPCPAGQVADRSELRRDVCVPEET